MTTEPLTLPSGPLVQHLQAAHSIARAMNSGLSSHDAIAVHAEHMRQVAVFTAVPHGTPPRPVIIPDTPHPDGWGVLVCDDAELVLCGWTDQGVFHQYASTEEIATALLKAWKDQLDYTPGAPE